MSVCPISNDFVQYTVLSLQCGQEEAGQNKSLIRKGNRIGNVSSAFLWMSKRYVSSRVVTSSAKNSYLILLERAAHKNSTLP